MKRVTTTFDCKEACKLASFYGKIRTAELQHISLHALNHRIRTYNKLYKGEYKSVYEPQSCPVAWKLFYANLSRLQ